MPTTGSSPLADPRNPAQVLDAIQEYEDHVDGLALGNAVRLPPGFAPNVNRVEELRTYLINASESFGADADRLKRRAASRGVHVIAGEDVEELRCRAQSEYDYQAAMDDLTPEDAPNQPARRLSGALRTLCKAAERLTRMVRDRREGRDFYDPEPAMLFDLALRRADELAQGIANSCTFGLPNPGHVETEVRIHLDEVKQAAVPLMQPFRDHGWRSRELVFGGGYLESIWVEDDETHTFEKVISQSDPLERKFALLAVPRSPEGADAEANTALGFDVFICHASDDKAAVVIPLSDELARQGLRVWVDYRELRLGDRLRQRIDDGLARSRFGVVVVSPRFFAKQWPKTELDGLVALEMADGKKRILPVWHDVEYEAVVMQSPSLAARLAVKWAEGLAKVAADIVREVRG